MIEAKIRCAHGAWDLGEFCSICGTTVGDPDPVEGTPAPDPVNHPDHYKVGGIETIDVIEAKLSPEEFAGFCRGNMLKYIARAGHKDDAGQDMRKALWYGERWLRARDARS